jgi:D-alanyl-D-alanine carboxypeptidase (penicillin-binding protein 5/6)
VRAPVQKGRKIGTLKVWRNDALVLEVPLAAAGDVGTGTIPGRAWDAASELLYGLVRAGVQKL